MNERTIKVTVEYIGHWNTPQSQDYRLLKIIGCPAVYVTEGDKTTAVRIGDVISEAQAAQLAKDVELTTIRRTEGR